LLGIKFKDTCLNFTMHFKTISALKLEVVTLSLATTILGVIKLSSSIATHENLIKTVVKTL
jgi:hypothetical protein